MLFHCVNVTVYFCNILLWVYICFYKTVNQMPPMMTEDSSSSAEMTSHQMDGRHSIPRTFKSRVIVIVVIQ